MKSWWVWVVICVLGWQLASAQVPDSTTNEQALTTLHFLTVERQGDPRIAYALGDEIIAKMKDGVWIKGTIMKINPDALYLDNGMDQQIRIELAQIKLLQLPPRSHIISGATASTLILAGTAYLLMSTLNPINRPENSWVDPGAAQVSGALIGAGLITYLCRPKGRLKVNTDKAKLQTWPYDSVFELARQRQLIGTNSVW